MFVLDGSVSTKSSSSNSQSTNNMANQNYLILSQRPNTPLLPELTIAELLFIVEESGVSLSEPCLYLTLRQRSKDSKGTLNILLNIYFMKKFCHLK